MTMVFTPQESSEEGCLLEAGLGKWKVLKDS